MLAKVLIKSSRKVTPGSQGVYDFGCHWIFNSSEVHFITRMIEDCTVISEILVDAVRINSFSALLCCCLALREPVVESDGLNLCRGLNTVGLLWTEDGTA